MKTTTVSVYAAFFFILVLSVSCRRDSEAPDVAFQKIEMCMESLPDTALYLSLIPQHFDLTLFISS